jgi:ADP-ribosylglycohydrolase
VSINSDPIILFGWAFYNSTTFEEGCLLAVDLGDDADAAGAIYGQITGAYYGQKQIKNKWIAMLHGKDVLRKYADGLQRPHKNWTGE